MLQPPVLLRAEEYRREKLSGETRPLLIGARAANGTLVEVILKVRHPESGILSLLKTRLSQRSCVGRSDRLFGRSWSDGLDSSSDIPLLGSHAARVGAGESRAAAATRRVESASATAVESMHRHGRLQAGELGFGQDELDHERTSVGNMKRLF